MKMKSTAAEKYHSFFGESLSRQNFWINLIKKWFSSRFSDENGIVESQHQHYKSMETL
jgi:hypothetical protein